jgi:hypothetical protein
MPGHQESDPHHPGQLSHSEECVVDFVIVRLDLFRILRRDRKVGDLVLIVGCVSASSLTPPKASKVDPGPNRKSLVASEC